MMIFVMALIACDKKEKIEEEPKPEYRNVALGVINTENTGYVRLMIDTLSGPGFNVLVSEHYAESYPDIISAIDKNSTYKDSNYEYYTLYKLKPGHKQPTAKFILGGVEFETEVIVAQLDAQEELIPLCITSHDCRRLSVVIGTGAAQKYLCSGEWNNWDTLRFPLWFGNGEYSLKDDCIFYQVPYDWDSGDK